MVTINNQNANLAGNYTSPNTAIQPPTIVASANPVSTPPQQISDQAQGPLSRHTGPVAEPADATLSRLLDPQFLNQLRQHPNVPANAAILHFAEWVQTTHPHADQLRTAKQHLIKELMDTQRNWVSDTFQIAGAAARTLGGVLMCGNFLSIDSWKMEWEGINQKDFQSASSHLRGETSSWVNRVRLLAQGGSESFRIAGDEAHQNDAALSLIQSLARLELRQISASRHPIEHRFPQPL